MPRQDRQAPNESSSAPFLRLALWFGIVMGLGEGALFLAMQELEWLHWKVALYTVNERILWVAPLVDMGVMLLAAGAVWLAGRWWKEARSLQVALVFFTFPLLTDWGLISGRIRLYGVAPFSLGLAMLLWQRLEAREAAFASFCRRTLPALVVALVIVFGVVEGVPVWIRWREEATLPAARGDAPNILILIVDTLRADHLSAYGYARQTSANVDRMAAQGVLFERAYSTSSWTLPSHASLMTGQYPSEARAERTTFEGRNRTLAEELRANGYRTAAYSANFVWFSRARGFGRGFQEFEDVFTTPLGSLSRTLWGRKVNDFLTRRFVEGNFPGRRRADSIASSILRGVDARNNRPFFIVANFMDVHDPYLPPQPWRSRFSTKPNPGGIINEEAGRHNPKLSPEQLRDEIDAYDGAISYMDSQIGRLLQGLKERGIERDTIVVFTSDHGEMLGEHQLYAHRNCLYLPVLHVPLILRWPGRLPEGIRLSVPVSNSSLAATLLDLAGLPPQKEFRAPSLAALWKSADAAASAEIPLAELVQMSFPQMQHAPSYYGAMRSAMDSEWQLIQSTKPAEELYSIAKDPQQARNLADAPEGRGALERLRGRLQQRLGDAQKRAARSMRRPPVRAAVNSPGRRAAQPSHYWAARLCCAWIR